MSVTRNLWGRIQKGIPFFKTFDIDTANRIAAERMGQIGIDVRDVASSWNNVRGENSVLQYQGQFTLVQKY